MIFIEKEMHHEHHQKLEILGRRPNPLHSLSRTTFRLSDSLVDLAPRRILLGSDSALADQFHRYRRHSLRFQPHLWSGHDGLCSGPHDPQAMTEERSSRADFEHHQHLLARIIAHIWLLVTKKSALSHGDVERRSYQCGSAFVP